MNDLLERLATSCPETWEGSGDMSGAQGDGMQWRAHCHHQPIRGPECLKEPMRGYHWKPIIIPIGMQTRWGS